MRAPLVLLALLVAVTGCVAQDAPNLITNPSFEDVADGAPAGWVSGAVQGEPQFAYEPGDDGMCVRITANAAEDFGRWNQGGIEAIEGVRVYRLSARIRTDVDGASARIVPVYSRDGQWHGANYAAIVVEGETGWQHHTTLIQPREGTERIEVTLRVNFEKSGTGTAWFDDVRLEPLPDMQSMPPIGYEPANELPPVSEDARAAGLVVFPRQLENIAMASYVPSAEEIGPPLTAWGAGNQRVNATFCVHALDDLEGVRASVTDLTGAGATISADRITLRPAHVLTRLIHTSLPDAIDVPTYLEPVDAMFMARGTTTWYWLTIDGVPPGEFAGEVLVQADDKPGASLPLQVEGLPIELREPDAALGFYYLMRDAIADPDAMRTHFAEMRARSMTSIGMVAPLHLEARDGAPVVIWDAENPLGVGMDASTEAGFTQPVIWLMSSVRRFCFDEFGPLESAEFAAAYASIIDQVQAHAVQAGWPEMIYQPIDEPIGHENRMAIALRCLPILKDAGVRTEEDGNLRTGDEDFEAMYPYVDLVNCNFRRHVEQRKLGTWESEMMRRCREDGKLLWTYNIDLCGYHPEVMRFGMGFGREACGSAGMIEWVWYSPREDPYTVDPDRRRQNMTYWYPPREGRAGGPSTGLEGAAEGAIDAAYIATFNAAVAKARASDDADRRAFADQAVAEYQAKLATISFTDLRTEMAIQGEWTVPKHPNAEGLPYVGGEYRMPNGWEPADYDRTRRMLADWIVKLGG